MRNRGFTLIELMVTVAMVAIMMALSAPSMLTYQRNSELTAATNSMVSAVNVAKGEALKRGRNVMITPRDGVHWTSGWRIFVDVDRTKTQTAGDIEITAGDPLPSYLNVSASGSSAADSPPYMMFDSSGYSREKSAGFAAFTLSFERNDLEGGPTPAETRRMIVASTGRVRSCKPTASTDPNYAYCQPNASQ